MSCKNKTSFRKLGTRRSVGITCFHLHDACQHGRVQARLVASPEGVPPMFYPANRVRYCHAWRPEAAEAGWDAHIAMFVLCLPQRLLGGSRKHW